MITEIFSSEWETILLTLYLFLLFYMVIVFTIWKRKNYKNKIKRSFILRSFILITKGVEDDTIKNKNDIFLIYKSIMLDITFADFLDAYIIYLRKNKDERDTTEIKVDSDLFNRISSFIKKIVAEERQEKPFEGVDNYEQRLLNLIDDAAQCGEKKSIHNNLADLATSIKNNQIKLKKADRINAWSIPISITSIIITICIWWFGRTSISTKDIGTIKQDNKAAFIEVITTSYTA